MLNIFRVTGMIVEISFDDKFCLSVASEGGCVSSSLLCAITEHLRLGN